MDVKKTVLAYSGGLDTSVILSWIKETYQAEIVAFCANIGQGEELKGLEAKAKKTGASKCYIADLQEEFARDFIFPMMQAGAVYESQYYLGTSIARPLIAKGMIDVARKEKAQALGHGATGKGNDQVRFELTYKALAPQLAVIAPWREWTISSREDALRYAAERKIPVDASTTKIYSRDRNIWHISHEGGALEDPANAAPDDIWMLTRSPAEAPGKLDPPDKWPAVALLHARTGALIDLPSLSVVTLGIDKWEKDRCQPIQEARLLAAVRKVLGTQVENLRMPPFQKSELVDVWSAEAIYEAGALGVVQGYNGSGSRFARHGPVV